MKRKTEAESTALVERRSPERGSIVTLFALSLVAIFFVLGISFDLGAAYVTHARMSQSVDAGVLAGARNSAGSDAEIKQIALKVARANFVGPHPVEYSVRVTTPGIDTKRISMTATTDHPTTFAIMMGALKLDVGTMSEATRYPLDLSLVLDVSYSLQRNRVFDDMQRAATGFLDYFDDSVDQVGIASYSTWATENLPVQKNFQLRGGQIIRRLRPISDTNIQEGLRVSKDQLDAAIQRPSALRIAVLFTDGRPTAYRDPNFTFRGRACPRYDAIAAAYGNGYWFRGLFRKTDGRKILSFLSACRPRTTVNGSYARSIMPREVSRHRSPGEFIRQKGIVQAEVQANALREAGYSIYSIALGNPRARNPFERPDLDFLARLTNEGGRTNAAQPRGELIFAPTGAQLEDAFSKLADRLLTRLTR